MLLREIILTDSDFLYDLYLKREKRDILTSIKYSEQKDFVSSYLKNSSHHPRYRSQAGGINQRGTWAGPPQTRRNKTLQGPGIAGAHEQDQGPDRSKRYHEPW